LLNYKLVGPLIADSLITVTKIEDFNTDNLVFLDVKGCFLVGRKVEMLQQQVGLEVLYAFYQVAREAATFLILLPRQHSRNNQYCDSGFNRAGAQKKPI
jgi:hypothetical protein